MGIEPTLFAWEARVLPLNDTRVLYAFELSGFLHLTPYHLWIFAGFLANFLRYETHQNLSTLTIVA